MMEDIPVIVGIGEIKDKPADPTLGREPLDLIVAALRAAEADANASLLTRLDALDIVNVVSWRYDNLLARTRERIGATPAHCRHGEIGGQTPVRFLHEAAQRIARGESRIAAICGAEASHTATWARRRNIALDWTTPPDPPPSNTDGGWLPARNRDYVHPMARRHGITEPITVYPLYETATAAAWNLTPAAAHTESAELWSRLSQVASTNPNAWLTAPVTAAEIATRSAANRPIAWPYPKLMVANPAVNQGAAILVTSLAVARAAGIAEEKLVFIHGGAAAAEPKDWMQRDSFVHAAGQEVVLEALLQQSGTRTFGAIELYSCFPVVPKMARRTLGLPPSVVPTAAGGLTFHGAPLNNYMTHGVAGVVRALRAAPDTLGVLYGQGGYLTWHHGLILAMRPDENRAVTRPFDLQAEADRRRGPPPPIVETANGAAALETFTVIFNNDATVSSAATVLRLPDGARTLARVPPEDTATLDILMRDDATPIGRTGRVSEGETGLLRFQL